MSKNIVVIDDSVTIQKSIAISLANEDITLSFASSAQEGLHKLKEVQPDLILADTHMPDKSGIELCKEIKADPHFNQTPVLLLASNQNPLESTQVQEAGAQDFLIKPFESQALIDKITELFTQPATAPVTTAPPVTATQPVTTTAPVSSPVAAAPTDLEDDPFGFDLSLDSDNLSSNEQTQAQPKFSEEPANDFSGDMTEFALDENTTLAPASDSAEESEDLWNFDSPATDEVFSEPVETPSIESSTLESPINTNNAWIDEISADSHEDLAPEVSFAEPEVEEVRIGSPIEEPDESEIETSFALSDETIVDSPKQSEPISDSFDHVQPLDTPSFAAVAMDQTEVSSKTPKVDVTSTSLNLSEEQIQSIVTNAFQSVIERVAWEVVPEIAEKIIREELSRLLKEK